VKISISKKDVIWNYCGIIMTLGANLFLLPLVLNCLADGELGLWYTFSAVGNIAILFDFGFKSTMARNITYAWCGAKNLKKSGRLCIEYNSGANFKLLNQVIEASKRIYFVIAFLAVFFLITVGSVYIFHVSEDLLWKQVFPSWVVYSLGIFFNLYYGYFNALLSGIGAVAEINKSTVLARAAQFVFSAILLVLGFGILSVSIAYLVYGIVFRGMARYYLHHYNNIAEIMKRYEGRVSKQEIVHIFQIVWHNAWRDGVISFTTFLNSQATTLLCSAFLSLQDTASYGLSLQLVNAVASVSTAYFSAYQPKMQELYAEKNMGKSREMLSAALVVYYVLFIFASIALCTIAIPLIKFIKSDTELHVAILAVLCLYMFLYKNHTLFASYIAGTNRIPYLKAYILSSIAMVTASGILLAFTDIGVWALVLVPLFVEACYNNWHWPKYVIDDLDIRYCQIFVYGFREIREYFLFK
jgi:hypothetical protein